MTEINQVLNPGGASSPETERQRALLAHLVSNPEATVQDYRDLYEEVLANFILPDDAHSELVDAGGVPAYLVDAPGTDKGLISIVIHGGGWTMGSARGYRELGYRISQSSGGRALVIDYRLAPENPFPAAHDDALAAYRWAREQPGVRAVAIIGDSAGGGIAAGALVALRDEGGVQPDAAVLISPLVDLAGEGASLVDRAAVDPLPAQALVQGLGAGYLAGRDPKATPHASALYADLHGLPEHLVLVGTEEGLYDDAMRYTDKVRGAGGTVTLVVGEGLFHIFPLFDFLPQGREATDLIGEFLARKFSEATM